MEKDEQFTPGIKCGKIQNMTMSQIFKSNFTSLECFLQMFVGYNKVCLLYYLTLVTDVKCTNPEECIEKVLSFAENEDGTTKVDFFIKGYGYIAKRLFAKKKEFINIVCQIMQQSDIFRIDYQVELGLPDIDGIIATPTIQSILSVFYELTTVAVSKYVEDGFSSYLSLKDKQIGIAEWGCDMYPSDDNYFMNVKDLQPVQKIVTFKNGAIKTMSLDKEVNKDDVTSIKYGYPTRFPSLINIWNDQKGLCPPNHKKEKITKKGWIRTTETECCVPQKSALDKFKRSVAALKTYKTFYGSFEATKAWAWNDAKTFLTASDDIRRTRIKDIQAEILSLEKNETNAERLADLEAQKKQFELLNNTTNEDEWQKAQRQLEIYRATSLKGGGDDFGERLRIEIIGRIEVNLYYYFVSSNNSDFKPQSDTLLGGFLEKAKSVVRTAKDYTIFGLILLLKHPRFTMLVLEVLNNFKRQICDSFAIEKGIWKLQSKTDERKETMQTTFRWSYLSLISILSDPQAAYRIADTICDVCGSLAIATSFVGGGAVSMLGSIAKPIMGDAISSLSIGLVYKEGFQNLLRLLDISKCGKEIALVRNKITLNNSMPSVSEAHTIIASNKGKLIPEIVIKGHSLPRDSTDGYFVASIAVLLELEKQPDVLPRVLKEVKNYKPLSTQITEIKDDDVSAEMIKYKESKKKLNELIMPIVKLIVNPSTEDPEKRILKECVISFLCGPFEDVSASLTKLRTAGDNYRKDVLGSQGTLLASDQINYVKPAILVETNLKNHEGFDYIDYD